jgi:hypothetical protein
MSISINSSSPDVALSFLLAERQTATTTTKDGVVELERGEAAAASPSELEQLGEARGGLLLLRRAAVTAVSLVVATAFTVLQPVCVPEALAVQPTLNEAIVEVSETSYPILRALDPTNFRDFSTKIGDLLLTINPDKLGKSIELAIDALDSVSSEKLATFNVILKDAYADLSVDSCTMVPLPPKTIVDKFAGVVSEKVDPDKMKVFKETWNPSLEALKKTDETICLPPNRASLDKLALAQADLARTFGTSETKAFVSYTGPLLKSSITVSKALSLVNDAKMMTPNASPQAKKDFAAAGKKAESASQLEVARNKIAEQKAKQAANKAALANK